MNRIIDTNNYQAHSHKEAKMRGSRKPYPGDRACWRSTSVSYGATTLSQATLSWPDDTLSWPEERMREMRSDGSACDSRDMSQVSHCGEPVPRRFWIYPQVVRSVSGGLAEISPTRYQHARRLGEVISAPLDKPRQPSLSQLPSRPALAWRRSLRRRDGC